jgi:protein-L-isoaspartate O-methyltransferase
MFITIILHITNKCNILVFQFTHMQDLVNYKSKANIIPIDRPTKNDGSHLTAAVNNTMQHFTFSSEEKKKSVLGQLLYRLNLLNVKTNDLILELGTGTGLQAAVLAELGAQVITVSDNKTTVQANLRTLSTETKNRIQVFNKSEIATAGSNAPFDKIVVSPEVSNLPMELYGLLSVGGDMVLTSDSTENPALMHVVRTSDDKFDVKKKTGLIDKSTSYEVIDL